MADILAENLSGKAVMGSDGSKLGMLYKITMNLKSGELRDLVVESQEDSLAPSQTAYSTDEAGHLRVPVDRVQAVTDYIVVQR